MAYASGTADVGEDAAPVCAVPPGGVRIRNRGDVTVYVGDKNVQADGDSAGYPVEPGTSEDFPGIERKETPVVPAPASDTAGQVLYARTAPGSGAGKIAYISF